MNKVTISEARKFSLESVQARTLLEEGGLVSELLCFEAGQVAAPREFGGGAVYQVLEGEALVSSGGATERLGKGKLLSVSGGLEHTIENAGGGLLVVLTTRAA